MHSTAWSKTREKQSLAPRKPNTHHCCSLLLPIFISLQQLSNKMHPFMAADSPRWRVNVCEQTPLIREHVPSRMFLSSLQSVAERSTGACRHLQSSASPPSFTGGGETFKGCHTKWKGTLFIRPECKSYQGSASALNQPGLLDTLKWKTAARIRHEERNRGRCWEWMWQRETADKWDLASAFMQVTSHIPFHLFLTTKVGGGLWNIDGKEMPWSTSLKSMH